MGGVGVGVAHTDLELFNTKCKHETSQLPKHSGDFHTRRKRVKGWPGFYL